MNVLSSIEHNPYSQLDDNGESTYLQKRWWIVILIGNMETNDRGSKQWRCSMICGRDFNQIAVCSLPVQSGFEVHNTTIREDPK